MRKNENTVRKEQKDKAERMQLHLEENQKATKKQNITYRKMKNAILSITTIIAFLLIVNCVGAWEQDVVNMKPYVIQAVIGLIWLTLFGYANRDTLIYRG